MGRFWPFAIFAAWVGIVLAWPASLAAGICRILLAMVVFHAIAILSRRPLKALAAWFDRYVSSH